MTRLSETTVAWGSLVFSGARGSDLMITSLSGWDELPDVRTGYPVRPGAHGRFDGPVWSDERVITMSGRVYTEDRDAALAELRSAIVHAGIADPGFLRITHAGTVLTTWARLTRWRPESAAGLWGVGYVPFTIEWRCADPLRYGDSSIAWTGFQQQTGGLEFDLFTDGAGADLGWLEFGSAGSSGMVTVSNPGTAETWPAFMVRSPVPPFTIVNVDSGARISVSRGLSAGELMYLDSNTGLVTINDGTMDYSGLLTRAEWWPVEPGSTATVAFLADGPATPGDYLLGVTVKPAWW